MQEKRIDRRVNRTRRMLREALMSLTLERGYEAVTVEEITQRADVGRTTFYLHYKDKEDLLVESVDTAINDLVEQISDLPVSSWAIPYDSHAPQDTPRSPILLVFQHASDNADLYRIIFARRRDIQSPEPHPGCDRRRRPRFPLHESSRGDYDR